MKNFKWLSLLVLLFSVLIFGGYNWKVLKNQDKLGPVITMDEAQIYVSIKDDESVLLKGVTATDNKDGDVTSSLVIESISSFVDGKRYVNYAAFDSDNHVSKASRKVVYTDYTPIRFSLEEPLRFPVITSGTLDVLGYIYAEDCLDGDISDRITFSEDSSISVYSADEYEVTIEVTNSAGDMAELPVTITMYDTATENAAPKIQLSEYLVYTKTGQALDARGYLESVTYRGTEYGITSERGTFAVDTSAMGQDELSAFQNEQQTSPSVSLEKFKITDEVDYQTPGVYEIQYELTDDEENVGNVNLVVVVEEE